MCVCIGYCLSVQVYQLMLSPISENLYQEGHISTTKTFITIPSTDATPKPLHAIRSGRQRALAPCDQLNPHNNRSKSGRQKSITITIVINSQQIRKAKINSRNNRDQFRDHPTPPITRDRIVTYTTTSLALCSRTAPCPYLLVPGPHATFAIAHAIRRSTSSFNRALSTSCPV